MAYTPLATLANLTSTPLKDLTTNYTVPEQQNLITRASRAIETYCGRRLAPFTKTESHRAEGLDPDESADNYGMLLDTAGILGQSRAQSLGSTDLVRHVFLRERPVQWEEMWTGAINTCTIYRSFSGSQVVDITTLQYETDTGHVRFSLGTFLPQGSTISINYTGGYSPAVPDDLIQATMFKAAELAIVNLLPEDRPGVDLTELRQMIASLCAPYLAD